MPKFFRGVVPAWLRHPARRGAAHPPFSSPVARAAVVTVEHLEQRKLFAVTTLTNGTGDGSLSIEVDAYGSYGGATNAGEATYDPLGPIGPAGTTFESAVWFSPTDEFLSESGIEGPALPAVNFATPPTATQAVSNFTRGGFQFNLTQTVAPVADQGTTFTQVYRVTNTAATNQTVRFVRHVDGDLNFQGGAGNDFAGVSADGQFVFEFDTAVDPTQASGFFGISTGGASSAYTVQPYRYLDNIDLNNGIVAGDVNQIFGDANNNRLTDNGYDVTVSLQSDFTIPAGATITYTSITRFGQGAPAEVVGTPRVEFAGGNVSRVENGRFATITVTRQGSTIGGATVAVDVVGGTATPGVDYTDPTDPTPLTLTFGPGQATQTFQIPIIDDDILDGDETVLLRLSNPSQGTILGTQVNATLTILDDTPFFRVEAPAYTVAENVGTARVTVIRTGSTIGEASIAYSTTGISATAGQDFTPVTGQLFFASGQREGFVDVPVTLDFLLEQDEQFAVVLSNPSGAGLGNPQQAVVTIENFETPPAILSLETVGFNNRITQIVLTFSTDLDPARAELHTNYELFNRKERPLSGPGVRQRININNAKFQYDPAADTVTITPVKGLKFNRFYELNVSGTRESSVAAIGGTPLDGNGDAIPGDDYRNYFARGNRVTYYDREGDLVSLRTENGGIMDIDRPVARDEAFVELEDVFPLESVLAGTFGTSRRQLSDNRSTIVVTNSFGVTRRLPPEIVVIAPDLPS